MADQKISALPAATVPLAGTEVLPIVQGGTTDKVSVANLTAGRAISCTGLTTLDTIGMSTSKAIGSGNGYAGDFSAFSYGTLTLYDVDGATVLNCQTNLSGAGVKIQTQGVTRLWATNAGDVRVATGNIIPSTAGKGVAGAGGSFLQTYNVIAAGGTLDLTIDPNGYGFAGILSVSATRFNFNPQSTRTVFAATAYGTTMTSTSLHTQNGASGGSAFTISCPSAGVVRVTDTSGSGSQIAVYIVFSGALNFAFS